MLGWALLVRRSSKEREPVVEGGSVDSEFVSRSLVSRAAVLVGRYML